VPLAGLDGLDLDKPLSVSLIQLNQNLTDRSHDRSHSEGEPVDSPGCILGIRYMMERRIPNGTRLVDVVELRTVVGQQRIIIATPSVREKKAVLLSLPPKLLDMIDLVSREEPPQRLDQLHWDVFVEQ
jgi:hypothetical protein